ncbi:MAG: lipid-A-disaccharide synthase [Steroidobacteraceae bacterium]
MHIVLVAGEASGDQLGAALIDALRERWPGAQFSGVCGPKMRAAGCQAWAASDELAVMGVAEVVGHLPRLLRLRRELVSRCSALRPDLFIGIDAPEFNLGLEKRLKQRGLRTVQYVSPQVWAWRQGRVRHMAAACDLVLCLLPFEPDFYTQHGVQAEFVGHPLADQFGARSDRESARAALGVDPAAPVIALLPGSRQGEVARLGPLFASTAAWLARHRAQLRFIAALLNDHLAEQFKQYASAQGADVACHVGKARAVLAAADVVIVASGTATLETLLSKRPMVVAYRLAPATAWLIRRFNLVKSPYFAQPNLLAGERLVPEFFQEAATADVLGQAALGWLDHPERSAALIAHFDRIHETLRCDGARRAVAAIARLMEPGL